MNLWWAVSQGRCSRNSKYGAANCSIAPYRYSTDQRTRWKRCNIARNAIRMLRICRVKSSKVKVKVIKNTYRTHDKCTDKILWLSGHAYCLRENCWTVCMRRPILSAVSNIPTTTHGDNVGYADCGCLVVSNVGHFKLSFRRLCLSIASQISNEIIIIGKGFYVYTLCKDVYIFVQLYLHVLGL